MAQESVVALVKDLTAKLSAVAEEFATRVDQVEPVLQGEPAIDASVPLATLPADPVDRARLLIAQRRLRRRFLPADLFHEPAWDMLLALYVAQADSRIMNVKTLVGAADAPVTTSQRWIDYLAKMRLVDRVTDPADRRRIEVTLSIAGNEAVEGYLRALDTVRPS